MLPKHSLLDADRSLIALLRARIAELETEIALLRSKLGGAAWRVDGHRAEEFIAQLLGGNLTNGSAPFDLQLPTGMQFEIKFANLNEAVKNKSTRRWNWRHILGSDRGKHFDRLLLFGPTDLRYRQYYSDPDAPYVMFDVPFDKIPPLMKCDNLIWISTNPLRARTAAARALFSHYQITSTQLVKKYT